MGEGGCKFKIDTSMVGDNGINYYFSSSITDIIKVGLRCWRAVEYLHWQTKSAVSNLVHFLIQRGCHKTK